MDSQNRYFMYVDFWITRKKVNQILKAVEKTIPDSLNRLDVEAELFIFIAGRDEIVVPILLFMFNNEPTLLLIETVKTNIHNILVNESDVYEEGEIVMIKSDNGLLPYQFMELNNYNQAISH